MKYGSLFAGIGGIDLGLEWAGMVCKWQVENDPYCQRVLAKHWPDVKRHDDVTTFPPKDWTDDDLDVDLICGGWPCQDLSVAGKGAGLKGERSGLFYEIIRLAGILRPRYFLLENVSALLSRGLGTVLGELAQVGYDAQWHCIPAASVGAPHRRDRVFILAHANAKGLSQRKGGDAIRPGTHSGASPNGSGLPAGVFPNTDGVFWQRCGNDTGVVRQRESLSAWRETCWRNQWAVEPQVGRVADGISRRVDRLRGLGNAVVPQVVEFIAKEIMKREVL